MSRVRYDHGFAWDVFISYAWADNQTTESWVESFEARLAKRLDESSGRVTRIWRDARRIGPGTVLTPAVSEAVQDSAVFLMVLSPSWHASDWCPDEYRQFLNTGYRRAVANRSRVMAIERYPTPDRPYPEGVAESLITRFFDRKAEGTPEHFLIPERETPGAKFEDPFTLLAGNLVETLRELERNPVRRSGTQRNTGAAVWFAPAVSEAMKEKRAALEAQVRQLGFTAVAERSGATLTVRMVGRGEPREAEEATGAAETQLIFVDPEAQGEADSLAKQLTRERAGHGGLEVLTDWTEFQERLAFRLRREDPPPAAAPNLLKPGSRVYFLHEGKDAARASELTGHITNAGCSVEIQLARSTRERTNQNKYWMKESDGVLLLNGEPDRDWLAMQLRHLVQFAPESKHRALFLDEPEESHKVILRQRQDVQVLDAVGGKPAEPLIRQFVAKLAERGKQK